MLWVTKDLKGILVLQEPLEIRVEEVHLVPREDQALQDVLGARVQQDCQGQREKRDQQDKLAQQDQKVQRELKVWWDLKVCLVLLDSKGTKGMLDRLVWLEHLVLLGSMEEMEHLVKMV